jgi:LacI family transcriptional regulator
LVSIKGGYAVPATMRDVAQKANVSIKTVSRVVNNQGEVSDETRQRVLAAIDALGFRPSKVARALVTQRTETLGLIIGDITNPYFFEVARGVLDAAAAEEYSVFVCNSDGDPEQENQAYHSLADHAVDGIITFPAWENEGYIKTFTEHFQPIVVVNRVFEHPGIGMVLTDIACGARLAVDHLVSQGHASIAMLAGRSPSVNALQRVQGYREAMAAHDLAVNEGWIVGGQPVMTRGYESTLGLFHQYPKITAIFAYNDLLALGAIQACHELGRRVPDDCAVVGFDNIQFAGLVTPALTTVHVDKYELGCQALNLLLDMLDEPDAAFPPIRMGVKLVVRESA